MKTRYKKILMYFFPIALVQVLLCFYDKYLESKINLSNVYLDRRVGLVHISVYFYFFIIPVYLMIANIIFNVKHNIDRYYKDVKRIYLIILVTNIITLIFNIVTSSIFNSQGMSCFLEFMLILIPQSIMFGIFSYLGTYLIKRKDEEEADNYLINDKNRE